MQLSKPLCDKLNLKLLTCKSATRVELHASMLLTKPLCDKLNLKLLTCKSATRVELHALVNNRIERNCLFFYQAEV